MAEYILDEIEIKAGPDTYEQAEKEKYDIIESEMEKLYQPSQISNIIDGVSIHSKEGIEKAKTELIAKEIAAIKPKFKLSKNTWIGIGAAVFILFLMRSKIK